MKNGFRIAIASAALTAGLAFAGASRANAQVSFRGSFPLPHGRISIGIGDPAFRVGSYAPRGYRVYSRSGYGYGFAYRSRWIPVRRYGAQWMVCDSPYGVGDGYVDDAYGYGDDVYVEPSYSREIYVQRPYTNRVYVDQGWGYRGDSRHGFDRRYDRYDRNDRWNDRNHGRNDRRDDRNHDRNHDGHRDGRDGRGDWRH